MEKPSDCDPPVFGCGMSLSQERTGANFTGPSNGYRDADDYYARASSGPHLGQIRRPVLCISAEDDPMIPVETLPVTVAGPWVQILRTARGGHVGFLAGSLVRPRFWAEAQAVEFLARRLVS